MWEILNVLKRFARGESKTAIKLATGRSRKTIRSYIQLAKELGWVPGLHEPDEVLATEVLRQVKPGRKDDDPGEVEKILLPHRQRITAWLKGQPGEKRNRPGCHVPRLAPVMQGCYNGAGVMKYRQAATDPAAGRRFR